MNDVTGDVLAYIGSFLDFNNLKSFEIGCGQSLKHSVLAWNTRSRCEAINQKHSIIFHSSFYSVIQNPNIVILILKQAMKSKDDKLVWSIYDRSSLADHIKRKNHLQTGDHTWMLVLTALRHRRWSLFTRLFRELIWPVATPISDYKKELLTIRALTPLTPHFIQDQVKTAIEF